jgi:hypothetical protein
LAEPEAAEPKAPARRGGRRKVEAEAPAQPIEATEAVAVVVEKAKPASRTRRKPAASADAGGTATSAGESRETPAPAEPAAPKRRAPVRRKAAAVSGENGEGQGGGEPAGE